MTVQQFWKGLAMLIVTAIVSLLGEPSTNYALLFLGLASTILGYVGKNLIFVAATTAITKIVSGLLVALGAGIFDSLGQVAVNGVILWPVLLKVVGSVLLTYIVTTFLAPPANKSRTLTKFNLSKAA